MILVLCLIPGRDLPQWKWADLLSVDKLAHATLFAVLVILTVLGLRRQTSSTAMRTRAILTALLFAIPYGGALEIMQGTLLTDRYADLNDFIANTVGCGLGWWWLWRRDRKTAAAAGA